MAAVSSFQLPRRKKATYGKSGNRLKSANINAFFEDDDPSTSASAMERQPTVKSSYAVQKTEVKAHALKPVRPRVKRQDTFDVPSSDDEDTSPARIISPLKFTSKRAVIDDSATGSTKLAPRERRKPESEGDIISRKTKAHVSSPDNQLRTDLAKATALTGKSRSKSAAASPERDTLSIPSPSRNADLPTSGAAARVASKRSWDAPVLSKRSALSTDITEDTPRKRVRTTTEAGSSDEIMVDVENDINPQIISADTDVYDIPGSSGDEARAEMSRLKAPRRPTQRGKLGTLSSRSSLSKGTSAPARLSEMLSTDTDTTEAPTRSPSLASRRSTPHQPSTPPSGRGASPLTTIKATGTLTPKQAQLWKNLLPSDPISSSPSALRLKDLQISGKRRGGSSSLSRKLVKSQSDVARRRVRLVDRLKASAPNSDDEHSDEEVPQSGEIKQPDESSPAQAISPRKMSPQVSQSESQAASVIPNGPRVTYSRVRSYLPEDNFEDDLMAGLTDDADRNKSQIAYGAKSIVNSHKSAFEMDEDDEESGPRGIRTIHELRASGRHVSGMYDIEELLRDIENHNASNRSRRRSALIELATKLSNKAFITRFLDQSCELQLVAQCEAYGDDIADFALAAAMATIMTSEPPEHAVRALSDKGVLAWLARLLDKDLGVLKMGKDRRNNMSKAAQASLSEFVALLVGQTSLWGEEKPDTVSPRMVALRALDVLISRLRRKGDKSDLLDADQLLSVLPFTNIPSGSDMEKDLMLSVSVLEALSTTSSSLTWPSSILERIAEILPQLKATSPTLQRTLFLALRLSMNLTNDKPRNSLILASNSEVVPYLLQIVKQGFDTQESELDEEKRTIAFDLLIIAVGIMINLAETCDRTREQAIADQDLMASLIAIFQQGKKRMLEAESVEESTTNVAYGYLAVMFANLCQREETRLHIASKLPGQNLGMLVEAVEEFVFYHQTVDTLSFGGEEGMEVWGSFTEKLKAVLARLKEVEQKI